MHNNLLGVVTHAAMLVLFHCLDTLMNYGSCLSIHRCWPGAEKSTRTLKILPQEIVHSRFVAISSITYWVQSPVHGPVHRPESRFVLSPNAPQFIITMVYFAPPFRMILPSVCFRILWLWHVWTTIQMKKLHEVGWTLHHHIRSSRPWIMKYISTAPSQYLWTSQVVTAQPAAIKQWHVSWLSADLYHAIN